MTQPLPTITDTVLDAAKLSLWLPRPGHTPHGSTPLAALHNISFKLRRGSSLGVIGESGSGKTLLALSLMGLQPAGSRVTGSLRLNTVEILDNTPKQWQQLRGNRLAMVFQNPMSALNPLHPIGRQVAEPLRLHLGLGRRAAWEQAIALLERVGIQAARSRAYDYPHQFSGGQRQRITIAMALACQPDVLIADEPTTALDVTVQQHILDLLHDLMAERQMALVLISHDLGVIAQNADDMLVLYGGQVVESGPTEALFRHMAHPYTRALLMARPNLHATRQPSGRRKSLLAIAGNVPPLGQWNPQACPFAPRCSFAQAECQQEAPARVAIPSFAAYQATNYSSLGAHHAWCLRPEALRPGNTQVWQ